MRFFPGATSLLKGATFIDFWFLKNFLRIFNFLFLWLCIKESNYLLFKRGLRLFKGLCLLFLPNVPGAMFIQGGTFIPDSRVLIRYILHTYSQFMVLKSTLHCMVPKHSCIVRYYTYALSFYRSQNVLCLSKFFMSDQKFIYIFLPVTNFLCQTKRWFAFSKIFFVPAQKFLKRHKMQSIFMLAHNIWTSTKLFRTCKRTRHKFL